jgi:DNA-binding transcriptional LysR family regulator
MAIKIEMLRCFSTVAQTGNLADAAVRLGRTQSAISMTLKQLEDHLGQSLFEGERKNTLTALGAEVFDLAQQQLRQFDETVSAIETSASAPHGLLRIASVPSVAGLVFPSAIDELTRRHCNLKVELRDCDSNQVIESLVRGQADIGVASGRHSLNGIRQERLFQDSFGLICAQSHALAQQKDNPTIGDVRSVGFVRNNLCDLIRSAEFGMAFTDCRVTVHNTLSLIGMVRTGKWVTVLPQTVYRIMPDDLMFRRIEGLDDRRSISLLIRERSPYLHLAEEIGEIVRRFDWR